MKLYLDASAIIYAIEGSAAVRVSVIEWISRAEGCVGGEVLTSRLSRLECRVQPLRRHEIGLLGRYDEFVVRPSLTVVDIVASVIDRATDLRARYGFKTPDAIHVATAMERQSELILTGDRDLLRCNDIKIQLL